MAGPGAVLKRFLQMGYFYRGPFNLSLSHKCVGVYLFDCGGEVTANGKLEFDRYESTYYYGRKEFKLFPCLPVPFAKYGAIFDFIARFLLCNSAFKHYPSLFFQTFSWLLGGESFYVMLYILLLLLR